MYKRQVLKLVLEINERTELMEKRLVVIMEVLREMRMNEEVDMDKWTQEFEKQ